MAEKTKFPCPPYATFPTFTNFLNKLRDTQVPGRIDPSVFGNASGSISYSVIAALKAFKLIAGDGTPTPDFINLVKALDDDRKPMLRSLSVHVYPTIFQPGLGVGSVIRTPAFDITNATASQFDEHIRDNYEAKGSTIDKVAAFFIAYCTYADILISDLVKTRKALASSVSSGKSKRQRRASEAESNGGGQVLPPPPPLPPGPMSEKALEYRLVDLMSDAMGDADVMQAIIKVVTFLKTRDATVKPIAGTGE